MQKANISESILYYLTILSKYNNHRWLFEPCIPDTSHVKPVENITSQLVRLNPILITLSP